jgi:hypothetical protein
MDRRLLLMLVSLAIVTALGASAYAARPATIFAQPSTSCTSATNVSTQDVVGFTLNNVPYTVAQNFISPDYAGITINGTSYNVYPNVPVTLNSNSGAYVEATQINYLPIQHSIDFIVCSAPQGPSTFYAFNLSINNYGKLYFAYSGTTLTVTSNSLTNVWTNSTISNVTASTPQSSNGYSKILAFNVQVLNNAPTGVIIAQKVPCYLTSGTTFVYILNGNTWVQVTNPSFNSSACTVSAPIPQSSTVGIFYSGAQAGSSSTTVSSSTTTMHPEDGGTTSLNTTSISTTAPTTMIYSISTTISTTTTSISTTTQSTTSTILPTTSLTTTQNTTTLNTTTTIAQPVGTFGSTISQIISEAINWFKKLL